MRTNLRIGGVTDAPHGQDHLRSRRIVLDLPAEPVDVAVHVVLVALVAVSPNGVEQLQPGVRAGIRGEEAARALELTVPAEEALERATVRWT